MHSPEREVQESRGREANEFEVLTQGYSIYLQSLGKSSRTAEEYTRDVRLWMAWFKRPIEHFKEPEWDDFIIHLQGSGKKGSTIKRYCIGLRRFFKYLRRRKIVTHDPSRDSESVKVHKVLPTWLLEREIDAVIAKAPDVRHRAILEVLYSCGLRNEELRALRLHQICGGGSLLQILGKGRKQRIVPVPARAKAALDAWLLERPADTDVVFPSNRKRQMGAKTLRRLVAKLVKAAGISTRVTPHTLRHSIATHLATRGVKIERIQLFLGHESPETTMVYIHLADSLVQSEVLKNHPHAFDNS